MAKYPVHRERMASPYNVRMPIESPLPDRGAPLAVLVSGGLDSAVLLGEASTLHPKVHPLYVRVGSAWESVEMKHLQRFLDALDGEALQPLVVLDEPVGDLYGSHWSLTGRNVPGASTPDEAVYLPGRNVLLLAKALLWCHLHDVPQIALAPLSANPFPDATPEFFAKFQDAVNQAVNGRTRILWPYLHWTKTDVIRRGAAFPLQHTFSCIAPVRELHCGNCNKCAERQRAFRAAGVPDPTSYAERG